MAGTLRALVWSPQLIEETQSQSNVWPTIMFVVTVLVPTVPEGAIEFIVELAAAIIPIASTRNVCLFLIEYHFNPFMNYQGAGAGSAIQKLFHCRK